jgi:glycosyltransferase involved in cell wall biosynthesis
VEHSRKLRVLTLTDCLSSVGGAERLAVKMTIGLDPDRFERYLCATRRNTPPAFLDELADANVHVLQLDRESRYQLRPWWRLIRLLRRERIDVVHAHKVGSNLWGSVLGRIARVPVIVAHEHSWSFEGEPFRRLLDRELIARLANTIIAVSQEDRRRMETIERIPARQITVIPNGIEPLPAPTADVRAELGIGPDDPVVGTVTVLRPEKALDVLVEAIALLRPRLPSLHLVIAGGGVEMERLRALVAERGLEQTVHLLGTRHDVANVLHAVDVAVICSLREGTPLALLEYMAAGLPVVATRVGGLPDVVVDGVTGLIVSPGSAPALADALERLLGDPELRAQMGAAGRERQQAKYEFASVMHRVEQLYERLLASRSR